jgi:hypothetical protein
MDFKIFKLDETSPDAKINYYFEKYIQAENNICFDVKENKRVNIHLIPSPSVFKTFKDMTTIYFCMYNTELAGLLQITKQIKNVDGYHTSFLYVDGLCSNIKYRDVDKYKIGYRLLDYMICDKQDYLLNHFIVIKPLPGLLPYYTKWVRPDYIYNGDTLVYGDLFKCNRRILYFLFDAEFFISTLRLDADYFFDNKRYDSELMLDAHSVEWFRDLLITLASSKQYNFSPQVMEQIQRKINQVYIVPFSERLFNKTLSALITPYRLSPDISNLTNRINYVCS